MYIFCIMKFNVSKLVLQKSFPRNICLKFQQFYCEKTDQSKLTILVESVAYSIIINFRFYVIVTISPKSELPKSDDLPFGAFSDALGSKKLCLKLIIF